MEKTERGRFRDMDIKDLGKWAASPLWDGETSLGSYIYPLRIKSAIARKEGERLSIGIPPDEIYRLRHFFCAKSPGSHISCFAEAIDFLVPDGTSVLAAAKGMVIEVQNHSQQWGPTEEFRDYLNYITIEHDSGEYTQYCHLGQFSVAKNNLRIGSRVNRGQQIAVVGKTGWTDRDHLHFVVFKLVKNESPFPIKSLKPRFKTKWLSW
ncbi:MAG: M23 family metallopeptidase [Minisyncoccia bacterium]|jgi:murein DD-endopeptidase MepM/ murein hydrolase activator NlpD